MSNVKVCVRFRPLTSRERRVYGESTCFQHLDAESFVFKDEKEGDTTFCFDRVFYQDSEQGDVYEFLAMPIVQDTVNAINGTIITYGQTGAGKTYSLEGPGILECDDHRKGLLPRVVDGLFECLKSSMDMSAYSVKLSMVEIYMERLRDLLNISKDNLQIKEGKSQGIYLSGATEVSILDPAEALTCLSRGIANKVVGATQMNMASSRSHCVYTFSVQHESVADGRPQYFNDASRVKTGKLMLVDLAGSEKIEKTGAEGKVLEEAKTINKSLSALGNVISALTAGKMNHIPYRNSKLTRILQDALGGTSRTALLCCCSPSSLNALESMSTLRFGTRTKLIKPQLQTNPYEEKANIKLADEKICDNMHVILDPQDRILDKLEESHKKGDLKLLPELFLSEGITEDPLSTEELEAGYDNVTVQIIPSLHQTIKEIWHEVEKLKRENKELKAELAAAKYLTCLQIIESLSFLICIIWVLYVAKLVLFY